MTLEQHKNARRWTERAQVQAMMAKTYVVYPDPDWRDYWARLTCTTIRNHSRKPSTRAEARRLLAILETR